ncbi:hypothetical protein [Priestia megaterium]|uniref:hypothetical protein n=1 Tax=Priestia megaterium TaxID=1404 RepID=UPI002E1CE7D2|nr:hypothetical protein [Priestia megaterium]
MRYSQIKKRLKETHAAGLEKIPRLGLYEKTVYLGANMHAKVSFTGDTLLHANMPVQDMVDYCYEKMQHQAYKKYYNHK